MMPSRSRLFLAPASAHVTYHSKIGFWDDQYGFKMPAMKAEAERIFGAKPLHDHVAKPEDMLAEAQVVLDWDMHTVEIEALKVRRKGKGNMWQYGIDMANSVDILCDCRYIIVGRYIIVIVDILLVV